MRVSKSQLVFEDITCVASLIYRSTQGFQNILGTDHINPNGVNNVKDLIDSFDEKGELENAKGHEYLVPSLSLSQHE